MSTTAVVGANWGDEGKGKIVDALAGGFDFVVRFQGGANAGHTVVNERGKFVLHLLPAGVFRSTVTNVIGPGVAVDAVALARELRTLEECDVPRPKLVVSDRAQVLLQCHRMLDSCEEERLGSRRWGSTESGIAPFYADKALKLGITVDDLVDIERLSCHLEAARERRNAALVHLYGRGPLEAQAVREELEQALEILRPFAGDTSRLLGDAVRAQRPILVEGQLGALRDPDHGIYPFVTSSSTLAGFAAVGGGMPPGSITDVIAVTKAYSTCVGAGPFVTELSGQDAQTLRARGGDSGEYGATTGRPRRVGWFDAPATRYGCRMQAATEVALTGLDVLSYLPEIPVCRSYDIQGQMTEPFPTTRRLELAAPCYETLPGWRTSITCVRRFADLPNLAQHYVHRIEELIEVPIRWISTGPARECLIERG